MPLPGKAKPDGRTVPLHRQASLGILRTADAITRDLDLVLKQYGLTATQYSVLLVLRGAGKRGASNSAIAERMVKVEPDTTRLLDRLERRAWIRRERDYQDRRSVTSWITVDGLKLLQLLDPVIREQNVKPFALVHISELRQLIAGLEKVEKALGR